MWKERLMLPERFRRWIKLFFAAHLIAALIGPAWLLCAYAGVSEDAAPAGQTSNLHIRADKLVSQREVNYIHFMGNVRVDMDQTQIKASDLKVFYEQLPSAGASMTDDNIKKIVASGNVRINFDNRTAQCDQAVYRTDTQTLVLTGETVEVASGNNSITGSKITFNQATGQIIVDGTPDQRVNAIIHRSDQSLETTEEHSDR